MASPYLQRLLNSDVTTPDYTGCSHRGCDTGYSGEGGGLWARVRAKEEAEHNRKWGIALTSIAAGVGTLGLVSAIVSPFIGGGVSNKKAAEEVKEEVVEEVEVEEVEVEEETKTEETVKKLLGDKFDKLSSDLKERVISNYENLKEYRKLEDAVIKQRLEIFIEANQKEEKKAEVKTFVEIALSEAGLKLDNETKDATISILIERYNLIELYNPSTTNEELKQKIVNYAKGLDFMLAEMNLANDEQVTFDHAGIAEAKNKEGLTKAQLQFAQEVVEIYDEIDPDGKISLEEFASYKATLTGNEDASNLLEVLEAEFDQIDINCDGMLSKEEMAVELGIFSNIKADGSIDNITSEEYKLVLAGKEAYQKFLSGDKLSEEEKAACKAYMDARFSGIGQFTPDMLN